MCWCNLDLFRLRLPLLLLSLLLLVLLLLLLSSYCAAVSVCAQSLTASRSCCCVYGAPQLVPEWPHDTHPSVLALGHACLSLSPQQRPTFSVIVKVRTM